MLSKIILPKRVNKPHYFPKIGNKQTLQVTAGINVIIGPNACGKTTILNAIRRVNDNNDDLTSKKLKSSIYALTVAVNQLVAASGEKKFQDERLTEILNYINTNYLTVTLDELEEQFHLSKPYLSKYIKEKSGKIFGELVKNVRMKKARTLLKGGNMTVESIAEKVGYQNVEHFTRLFKKKYGMTPVQFRNEEK